MLVTCHYVSSRPQGLRSLCWASLSLQADGLYVEIEGDAFLLSLQEKGPSAQIAWQSKAKEV